MAARLHDVVQHHGAAVAVDDDDVDAAVVVDVAERRGAAAWRRAVAVPPRGRTSSNRGPGKPRSSRLGSGIRIRRIHDRLAADTPVRLVEVELAVVVEIEQRRAESRERTRWLSAGRPTTVSSTKKRPWLLKNESDSPSRFTTSRSRSPSSSASTASTPMPDFAVPSWSSAQPVASADSRKRAVALIQPQMIRRAVVGDEDVDPAVAVEIAGHDAETVADGGQESRRSRRRR